MFKKQFCCSSQARTVATAIALIDIGFGIVFTLLTCFFLYIFVNYPETLRSMVAENPAKQRDLEKLLAWGPQKQAIALSIPMTASLTNIIMGLFLLFAARTRNVTATRIWFVLTIIFCIISMVLFIPEVIFTQEKFLIIIFSLIDYFYNFWCIWIAGHLISELSAGAKDKRGGSLSPALIPPLDDLDLDSSPDPTSSSKATSAMLPEFLSGAGSSVAI